MIKWFIIEVDSGGENIDNDCRMLASNKMEMT